MHHVAIMNPHLGLLSKILLGEKTIESRRYRSKHAPWDRISSGDVIYFKDAGKSVTVQARASYVQQVSQLTPLLVSELVGQYHHAIGLGYDQLCGRVQDSTYVILIGLTDVQKIVPFDIDKTGFSSQSAWICVEDITTICI